MFLYLQYTRRSFCRSLLPHPAATAANTDNQEEEKIMKKQEFTHRSDRIRHAV
jgi:hypothetical protein